MVGQTAAKRAVAVAFEIASGGKNFRRNRPGRLPKNILMIGSTGVGKTEIARRLARLANSPFIKIEASKFTEVGYVGRDVESMVRELTEVAIDMTKQSAFEEVRESKPKKTSKKRFWIFYCPNSNSYYAANADER